MIFNKKYYLANTKYYNTNNFLYLYYDSKYYFKK